MQTINAMIIVQYGRTSGGYTVQGANARRPIGAAGSMDMNPKPLSEMIVRISGNVLH